MEVNVSGEVRKYWKDLNVYLEMNSDRTMVLVTLEDENFRVLDLAYLERNSAGGGQSSPQKTIGGD